MKANNLENPLYRYKKLIFIFIIILLTVIVGIANIKNIKEALNEVFHISFLSVVVLLALLLVHLFFDSLVLFQAIDDPSLTRSKAFLINMAGNFFSEITPFYIGSYPSRFYYLYKENVPVSKTLSAFTIRGLSYQIVLNIVAIISFIFAKEKMDSLGGYALLFYFGLLFNFTIGLTLFLISVSKKINRFVVRLINKLALKISFIRKRQDEVLEAVEGYYTNARRVYTDIKYSLKIFLLMTGKILIMYIMPLVVFAGLGINVTEIFWEIISFSSLIAIIASVFPSPGGMASSEAVFILLFNLLIPVVSTVHAGMLIWRLFSFYAIIIIGLVATLILQAKEPKRNNIKNRS